MDLMGSEAVQSEEAMRRMWGDSMKAVKCQNARITYDDFLLLMKGQTREHPVSRSASPVHPMEVESIVPSLVPSVKLHVVPEGEHPPEILETESSPNTPRKTSEADGLVPQAKKSSPLVPRFTVPIESPLSMDDDEDLYQSAGPGVPGSVASLTPPSSPVRGATDYVTPRSGRRTIEFIGGKAHTNGIELPGLDILSDGSKSPSYLGRGSIARKRSVSLDDKDVQKDSSENVSEVLADSDDLHKVADIVRDMLLPETDHTHQFGIDDKSKSALAVNRKLYRAHRQMRLAVLEASKRFEEQQAQHAKEVLMARQAKEGGMSAGLVMRHGYSKQISSDAIRQLMAENQAQQQQLVAKASRKGGRGKRTRKKTISDMSGMLTSIGQDEMGAMATEASAPQPPELPPAKASPILPKKTLDTPAKNLESEGPSRAATVPGEFRATTDPFSRKGRYGGLASPM